MVNTPVPVVKCRSIQGLLNRLVPDPATFEVLVQELVVSFSTSAEEVGKEAAVEALVDKLHKKAVSESKLTAVYADCTRDIARTLNKKQVLQRGIFNKILLEKCETCFNEHESLEKFKHDEYVLNAAKERKIGNMRFIAELHNRCSISTTSVSTMLNKLTGATYNEEPTEDNMEALRVFLLCVIQVDNTVDEDVMKRVRILQDTHSSRRVRLLLLDVTNTSSVSSSFSAVSTPPSNASTPYDDVIQSPPSMELLPTMRKTPPSPIKPVQKKDGDRASHTVHMVGIDASIPDTQLVECVEQLAEGKLNKVRLCGDTTNRTIYGFFEFTTVAAARTLVNRTHTLLGKYYITCNIAKTAIRDPLDVMSWQQGGKLRQFNFEDSSPVHFLKKDRKLLRPNSNNNNNNNNNTPAWDSNRVKPHVHNIPEIVKTMAMWNGVGMPQGMPSQLGDLGTRAVCNAASDVMGCGQVLEYIPAFLGAVEAIYRVDAMGVIMSGIAAFCSNGNNVPHAWRLAYLLTKCFGETIVTLDGLIGIVNQIHYTHYKHNENAWSSFSIELTRNLVSYGVNYSRISEIVGC
eukprot:TRINITY_DN737_c0_g1_i1.p1 TRINITY_DN737_c0_g1~~TRINITY_DN737_c0_g1_i1.p1  ORF type:complete len:573 (+),score=71.89 TRINITY_DN737_c0_g1_i1:111-1829(+)